MEFDILIFIQAAGDTGYALDLIKKNERKKIHLCVVNVKNVYLHLNSLSLENVKLEFYPYINLNHKNVLSIYKARAKINKIYAKHFAPNLYKEIFFFSRFFDWLTPSLIAKYISNRPTNISYINYSDEHAVKTDKKLNITSPAYFAHKYFIIIVKFVTGVHFFARFERRTIEFDYEHYRIKNNIILETIKVPDEYKVSFAYLNSKSILFLLSPVEIDFITEESELILNDLLLALRNLGYNLVVKGHPRLGVPIEYLKCFKKELPSNIPVELMNFEKINSVVGVISSGLASLAQEYSFKVNSILDTIEFENPNLVDEYKKFLMERSNNKVLFPKSIDEIERSLATHIS